MILFRQFLLFLWVCQSIEANANTADINKSISIDANYAERNQITGKTEYRGNVVIRQGSILIDAENVTIHYDQDKVSYIICEGSPASYQQQLATGDGTIIARAERIEYQLTMETIDLKTNASLARNGTYIKGDSITYDLSAGTWKAKGGDQGTKKRIQLVIPPITMNNVDAHESVELRDINKSLEEIL